VQVLLAAAGVAILPAFFLIGWFQGTYVPWQDFSTLALGLASAACVVLLIAICLLVRQAVPLFFGQPFGITATNAGVEYRTELGGHRFLPWEEIRVLEVRSSSRASRNYMLYGARTSAGWTETEGVIAMQDFAPDGITREEMTYRLQALLDLIGVRMGLRPRTFSKRLQAIPAAGTESPASQPGASRVSGQQVGCAAFLVLFAAAPIALAVAVLRVPFSGIQALNDVMAASLCLTALLIVGVAVWTVAMARRTPRAAGKYVPTSAPPSGADDGRCTLAYAIPTRIRLTFLITGLLLCLDILPFTAVAAATLVSELLGSVQHVIGGTPGHVEFFTFGKVLGYFMIPFTVGGPIFLWFSLRFATFTLYADTRGLPLHARSRRETLLWESAEKLTATRRGDRIIGYAAKGGRVQITWPSDTGRLRLRHIASSTDVMPITPEELMALAMARTGLAVELLTTDKPTNAG
jgi:hypothetical protein